MEKYNQFNISAFGLTLSILGGFFVLLAINLLFDTALANIPIFLVGLIWTASAGIFVLICDQFNL